MICRMTLVALMLVGLLGCAQEPLQERPSNNPNVPVSLLFEHDGCKVYRFYDASHYRYFAKCDRHSSVSWNDTTSTGKVVVVTPHEVTTDYVN